MTHSVVVTLPVHAAESSRSSDERQFRYWLNTKRTPVIAELISLAAERSGCLVEYRDEPGSYEEMDPCDRMEAWDAGYNPDRLKATMGSMWCADYKDKGEFWAELRRLEALVKKPLEEPIFRENGRIIGDFMYVVDGVPKRCEIFSGESNLGITPAEYMRRTGATEIRRYDMTGRQLRLPEAQRTQYEKNFRTQIGDDDLLSTSLKGFKERMVGKPHHWDKAGRTICQAKRRPRTSNKIKKVK